jgi:hypothetical protein
LETSARDQYVDRAVEVTTATYSFPNRG